MNRKTILKGIGVSVALTFLLAACGTDKEMDKKPAPEANDEEVTKVKVAYDQASKPISWTDENGEATGYDVEVMKLVDELLPEYEFEYVGTTNDDLLIGVEQGKYEVGVKNAFLTEERLEKFIYPKEFIGLSSTGFVLKKENAHIKSLEDFASAGLSLVPIVANSAQYTIINEYNEKNPDNQVKLVAGDTFIVDVIQWVNEGREDGAVIIEGPFEKQVIDEDGPHHNLKDEVVYNEFAVIETWPLFNKKQQDFADAYDKAIQQLKVDKKLNELSTQFYGRDLFEGLETK